MDTTASENTSGQPATQEQKITTGLPFIFEHVRCVFELFNFQTLNLEIIASEIFHSPEEIEFRATKDFLDRLVKCGLLETSQETYWDNAGPLTKNLTTRAFKEQVWKLK